MYYPKHKELFHIHTYRCKHAENVTDEAYMMKAIELGAERIVFTDHAPFPGNPFGNRMDFDELNGYVCEIKKLKDRYKDKIEILCGLEVEYLPSYDEYIKSLKKSGDFDLLVLGQHIYELPGNMQKWSFMLEDKSKEHIYLAEATVAGINTGYFDVVAHPDRVFRRVKEWSDECRSYAIGIIESAQKMNVYLEKNFSSMQRKRQYRKGFWDNVTKAEMIVYGIDAHSIDEMEEWVRQNDKW